MRKGFFGMMLLIVTSVLMISCSSGSTDKNAKTILGEWVDVKIETYRDGELIRTKVIENHDYYTYYDTGQAIVENPNGYIEFSSYTVQGNLIVVNVGGYVNVGIIKKLTKKELIIITGGDNETWQYFERVE